MPLYKARCVVETVYFVEKSEDAFLYASEALEAEVREGDGINAVDFWPVENVSDLPEGFSGVIPHFYPNDSTCQEILTEKKGD